MRAKNYRKDAQSLNGVELGIDSIISGDVLMVEDGRIVNKSNIIDGGSA